MTSRLVEGEEDVEVVENEEEKGGTELMGSIVGVDSISAGS